MSPCRLQNSISQANWAPRTTPARASVTGNQTWITSVGTASGWSRPGWTCTTRTLRAGQRRRGTDQASHRRPLVVEDGDGAAQVVVVSDAVVFDAGRLQGGGDGGEVAVPLRQGGGRRDHLGAGTDAAVGDAHLGAERMHGVATAPTGEGVHEAHPPVRGQHAQQGTAYRLGHQAVDAQGDHASGRPAGVATSFAATVSAARVPWRRTPPARTGPFGTQPSPHAFPQLPRYAARRVDAVEGTL